MALDSTLRLKQLNQPELSGYTVQVIQNYLTGNVSLPPTGTLTGVFYPLKTNPSGYVTSGQTGSFMTQTNLNSLSTQLINYIDGNFYPISNPSGYYASNFRNLSFRETAAYGADNQFIYFPSGITISVPKINSIVCTFENDQDDYFYNYMITGIVTNGFGVKYSNDLASANYKLNVCVNYSA